jgi:hypothetical protein
MASSGEQEVLALVGPFRVTQRRISTEKTTSRLQQRRKIHAGSPFRPSMTPRLVVVVISVRKQQRRERRHMVRSSGLRAWLWVQISGREFSYIRVKGNFFSLRQI